MSDQMQSEIAELNQKVAQIEDPRRSYALVQERIQRLRKSGNRIPEELSRLERSLMADCLSESQGR